MHRLILSFACAISFIAATAFGQELPNPNADFETWMNELDAFLADWPSKDTTVPNGDFETWENGGLADWSALWTRDPGTGILSSDTVNAQQGAAAHITHTGANDWSLTTGLTLPVRPGDLHYLYIWIKIEGEGNANLGCVTYDADNAVIDWQAGTELRRIPKDGGWAVIEYAYLAPAGVDHVVPRVTGNGPADIWLDDIRFGMHVNLLDAKPDDLPPSFLLENTTLSLRLDVETAMLTVRDKRTGETLQTTPSRSLLLGHVRQDEGLHVQAIDTGNLTSLDVHITLDQEEPEFLVTLEQDSRMKQPLAYPGPFLSEPGQYLILPMNEGISYPVEEQPEELWRLVTYGGHGVCMPFFGFTDGGSGYIAIVETPDDAAVVPSRHDGRLTMGPQWEPQMGRFGYARRVRYVLLDDGGHVAIAKRYRDYAKATGLFKTLRQKREENPNVDLLIGAANIWCWDQGAPGLVAEMKAVGMDRVLWSNRRSAEELAALNAMDGVLTSRYDIYQDLMDPELVEKGLVGRHPDWTQDAWPDDIIRDKDGNWIHGWVVKRQGEDYPCAVLCDTQAVKYARERISEELKTHPYRSRFIDTTTASAYRECYDPDHPMTRTQCRESRMALLGLVSGEMGLVCGSETGVDAAVPYAHYFEGMLSLGPYRVPDAGRDMQRIWDEVPKLVGKYQLGHKHRIPLWELVYHDCVVAQWYWGDYNNKLPALWKKRDLFNLLYGTPPMYMFHQGIFRENKERFAESYQTICPTVRRVGYEEMVDHRFLTPDRDVQQTVFANGVTVTVNFGDTPYTMDDGAELEAVGYAVH